MGKMRVHELAKDLGVRNNELLTVLKTLGQEVTNHMSMVDDTLVRRVKAHMKGEEGAAKGVVTEQRIARPDAAKTVVIRRRAKAKPAEPEKVEEAKAEEAPSEEPKVAKEAKEEVAPAAEAKPVRAKRAAQPAAEKEPVDEPAAPTETPAAASAEPESAPAPEPEAAPVEQPAEQPEEEAAPEAPAAPIASIEKVGFEQARILDKPRIPLSQLQKSAPTPSAPGPDGIPIDDDDARGKKGGKGKPGARRRVVTKRQFQTRSSADEEFDLSRGRRRKGDRRRRVDSRQTEITTPKAIKRKIRVGEAITVGDLAHNMGVKAVELTKRLMELGVMATINQGIDADTAAILAGDFGYEIENVSIQVEDILQAQQDVANPEALVGRPPVVTVMGHVDHGKTSLLDAIRKTEVAEGEAGGITQHIGAYQVHTDSGVVTFIDTPGHAAFTAMRARGAHVTDIVILVVAANDGVMPQTIEAINHAKAAGVPVIVAVNKTDLPDANGEKVRQQLTEYGLLSEAWGGDVIFEDVSAMTGAGIPALLESILLQAEVLDLKADPTKLADGVVVESRLDKGRGPVATVLVQDGTLKVGQDLVAGTKYGRVRAMLDPLGKPIKEAGPSMPVEVLGLSEVPPAGEKVNVVKDEKTAKQIAEHRSLKVRELEMAKTSKVSLEDLYKSIKDGEIQELRLIIKADVQGSIEALKDSFEKLSTGEVKVRIIHTGVGAANESDVMLASASNAVIICFNTRPEGKSTRLAEQEGIDIETYSIIYEAVDAIRSAMEGMLSPEEREIVLGRAEVRQVFNITRSGTIAGCMVTDGKILRNAYARLLRDGIIVYKGKIGSLKRMKDDAREVQSGFECGISLENFDDIKAGDEIEAFDIEEVARKLGAAVPAAQSPAEQAAAEK